MNRSYCKYIHNKRKYFLKPRLIHLQKFPRSVSLKTNWSSYISWETLPQSLANLLSWTILLCPGVLLSPATLMSPVPLWSWANPPGMTIGSCVLYNKLPQASQILPLATKGPQSPVTEDFKSQLLLCVLTVSTDPSLQFPSYCVSMTGFRWFSSHQSELLCRSWMVPKFWFVRLGLKCLFFTNPLVRVDYSFLSYFSVLLL